MRFAILVAAFAVLVGINAAGCGSDHNAYPPGDAATVEAQSVVTPDATCPLRWFCDSNGLTYSTMTACETACGVGMCYRDYYCNGTCFCP